MSKTNRKMESGDSKENKFKVRPKPEASIPGNSKSDAGISNYAIITDDNSAADDTQEGSNVNKAVLINENQPALDSRRFQAPKYERDKEQIVVNTELLQSHFVNTRALHKEATTYKLELFDKHALVIFNHNEIPGFEPRSGTQKDVDALTTTFENFGFEVTSYNDLTKDEIFEKLDEFSKRNFTDYGCVAVAILTHGDDNGELQAADQPYSETDVINQFKVDDVKKASLVSKPKIFIIQACRGSEISSGVPVLQSGQILTDNAKKSKPYYILPLESDLLILHSSYPGCASHRNVLHGSWFIQILCTKINTRSSTQDFESIITEVKRAVAIDMEYKKSTQVNKQMPVMTSTLIRKLHLKKYKEQALEETVTDMLSLSESRNESCTCFLEHFTYMRNCLRHFVADNPNDKTVQDILDVANTYNDSVEFNESKDKMCKVMSNLVMNKARDSQIYKYLHFVPTERQVTKSENAKNESPISLKSSFSSLDICLSGFFVATFVLVLYRNVKST